MQYGNISLFLENELVSKILFCYSKLHTFIYDKKTLKVMIKFLFKVTSQSAILFFAVSFLTVLYYILPNYFNLPKETRTPYGINIGFPFQYYERFWLDIDFPNEGWNFNNLFYNCVLFWLFTFIIYFFKDKANLKSENIIENDILDK